MIPVKETKQNKLVRIEFGHEPVEKRIQHFRDFTIALDEKSVNQQSAACTAVRLIVRRCVRCTTVQLISISSSVRVSGTPPGSA